MEIGTILWSMVGKRQNDEIKWYAKPQCVEKVTDTAYYFGDGCGGSFGNIGKNDFLSREECINHFLETHDSLTQKIPIEDKSPDNVYDLPRTNWQEWQVTRFDSIETTSVYRGGFGNLKNVTDTLKWHSEYAEGLCMGMDVETLTLTEISEQLSDTREIITVIQDGPMKCKIFQYGNYNDGKWYKLGEVMGYA